MPFTGNGVANDLFNGNINAMLVNAPKAGELQTIRDKLKEIGRIAENAVKDLGSFSFTDFENEFIYNNSTLFRYR
jgi:hypothetical protein